VNLKIPFLNLELFRKMGRGRNFSRRERKSGGKKSAQLRKDKAVQREKNAELLREITKKRICNKILYPFYGIIINRYFSTLHYIQYSEIYN
jgi:hypothetical protein